MPLAGFKLTQPVLLVYLDSADSVGLVQLFSVQISTRLASSPALQQPLVPQVQACTLLGALGVLCVHSPWCLGCFLRSLRGLHFPWCLIFWLDAPHTPADVPGGWVERRLELLLQEKFQNCPWVSLFFTFSFWEIFTFNPASPYSEGPVLSHSPPVQLDQGLSGSGPLTAQLSTIPSQRTQSLWVYHFVLIPLPVNSSNQVSLGAP